VPGTVLFLDDKSAHEVEIDQAAAVAAAKQLVETIQAARKCRPGLSINSPTGVSKCLISSNWSLGTALANKQYQIEWDFLRDLAQRSPLTSGFEAMLADVASHQVLTPTGKDSAALVCAWLMQTGTLSLSGHPDWQGPWIDCQCTTLNDDSTTSRSNQQFRNASHPDHVAEHADWLKALDYDALPKAATLWAERDDRFPGIRFLPRVRKDLNNLACSGAPYKQAIDTLSSLSSDVQKWEKGKELLYSSKISDCEHFNRRQYCLVTDEDDKKYYFDAHAYFTGGVAGRIYFRLDADKRELVVAFVGLKLNGPIVSG